MFRNHVLPTFGHKTIKTT
ncbi:hypothetical protein [Bacillus safensis]